MDDDENGKTGHRERLREQSLNGDASSRTDAALLELLLTFGTPRRDVQALAKSLIARFGGHTKPQCLLAWAASGWVSELNC